jgi:hypothetical protein
LREPMGFAALNPSYALVQVRRELTFTA